MQRPLLRPDNILPFRGGCNTVLESAQLPIGAFSMVQNLRGEHPGFRKRPGQRKLHSTADGTNKVMTLFQFEKTRVTDSHFFAQMSDGDVLEATNDPPTVTTGAFGSEAFDGSTGQIKASWAVLNDLMVHSNGADQHQIYGGSGSYVEKFLVVNETAAIPTLPEYGLDYRVEVSDGLTSTVAVLDSLGDLANDYECIFIRTPVPVKSLTFTFQAVNGTAAELNANYWKNDNTWAALSITDGTETGGDTTFAQNGTVSWTPPSDEIPRYMFGGTGFWYQIYLSSGDNLDAEVEISAVTWAADFQDIQNVWDAAPVYAIEVLVEGTTQWEVYASTAVDIDSLTSGKKIMIASSDPIEGIYIDPGGTPNATGTALTSLKYWTGTAWASVGTVTDGTNGMSNAGWLTFPRTSAQPRQFETSQYYAYWYELIWDSAIAADTVIAIQVMPHFDIDDFGSAGYVSSAWKDRMCYTFDLYGAYLYVSSTSGPMILNGTDYGILQAGDGRSNRVLAMAQFKNELIAWQEEKGTDGGCTTLFEGYSPTTFGRLLLSSKIGIMNADSFAVVDGVMTATETGEEAKTLVFWLSRYGVCVSDGKNVSIISDDIQNYFDPTESEAIRRGYEDEMWLAYDSAFNVIRVGLVSGSSATVPNVFPVFDLVDKEWSFDVLGQELSCMAECASAASFSEGGTTYDPPVVQVGGGTDDGTVYHLNYGKDDVSTAIESYVDVNLQIGGEWMELRELIFRCKVQAAGNVEISTWNNGVADLSDQAKAMTAEATSQTTRRHRISLGGNSDHFRIRFKHDTAAQEMKLYDMALTLNAWEQR